MTEKTGQAENLGETYEKPTIHILEDRVSQHVWLCGGDVVAGLIVCFDLEATDDGRIRVPGGGCNKTEIALLKEYKAKILARLEEAE